MIIFVLLNIGIIAYTAVLEFSGGPPDKLSFSFGLANLALILCGFGCALFALAIETFKYVLMMKTLDLKVSLKHAFQVAALGKYYDNITPSAIGGQPFQIYYFSKNGYDAGKSLAMPLSAFFTMQAGFVILALVAFIFFGGMVETLAIKIPAYVGLVLYALAPSFIILSIIFPSSSGSIVLFIVRLGAKLRIIKDPAAKRKSILKTVNDYHMSIRTITTKKGLLLALLFLSVIYQIAIMSIPFFMLQAYNGSMPYLNLVVMSVFIYCAITIVPTPGNSGAAEGSFYLLFSTLDASGLFWAMLIWRLSCYYLYIAIGGCVIGYNAVSDRIRKRRKNNEPEMET